MTTDERLARLENGVTKMLELLAVTARMVGGETQRDWLDRRAEECRQALREHNMTKAQAAAALRTKFADITTLAMDECEVRKCLQVLEVIP